MREVPCPACGGSRLKPVSMAVTLGDREAGGMNIAEVCALPINETAELLRNLELTARERQIGERVLKEIQERLNFLLDVGLDYLSLDRPSGSLSRRRGPADPAGHPDRRRPGRRPLRPRRALDRAAPARQPPADRDPGPAQGPRQHADRRRARRGHHPGRRLGRRHRPRRRRARRPGRAQRHRPGPARAPRLDDRRSTSPAAARSPFPACAARAPPAASSPSTAPASTTCATST